MKRQLVYGVIAVCVLVAGLAAPAMAADDPADVAVIDTILNANPGNTLGWTTGNPDTWNRNGGEVWGAMRGINWNNEPSQRITEVAMQNAGLSGSASFVGLDKLRALNLQHNSLNAVDVGGLSNLEHLDLWDNSLTSLDVSGLSSLQHLDVDENQLASLDLTGLTSLESFWASNNQLTSLGLTGLTNLQWFNAENNQLTSLDLTGLTNLQEFDASNNQLTSLDITGLTNLQEFDASNNQLTSLDITGLTNLEYFSASNNRLTSLDLTGLTNLESFDAVNNQLTSLDLTGLTNLEYFYVQNNQLTSLDLTGLTNLEYFYAQNNQLTSLDLTGLTNLQEFYVQNNQLTSLELSGLTNLQHFEVQNNQLTSLELSGLTNLEFFQVQNNQLTSLGLTGLTSLRSFNADNNQLATLNLTGLTSLRFLFANNNQLTSLDLTGLTSLVHYEVDNNRLPLSQLYAMQDQSGAQRFFGVQNNAVFVNKRLVTGEAIDLSAEAEFNGTATTFDFFNAADGTPASSGTENGGMVTFDDAGKYYIQMQNTEVKNDYYGNNAIAVVSTGVANVKSASGWSAAFGSGLGSDNTRALSGAIVSTILGGGLTVSNEFDALLTSIEDSGDADKVYILDSLHGETLAGGMDAIRRMAGRNYRRAVYGQATRRNPFAASATASAGGEWTAYASLSGGPGCMGGGVFGDGALGRMSSHDGYFGYDVYNGGANAFLDRWFSEDLLVGGSFGAGHTKVEWNSYDAKTNANNLSGALYGSVRRGAWSFTVLADGGYADVSTRRDLPTLGMNASGSYKMWWLGAGARASYGYEAGDGWLLTPSLGLDYQYARSNSFSERNAGAFGLDVERQHSDSFEGLVELAVSKAFCLGRSVVTPSLRVGGALEMADRRTSIRNRFRGEPNLPSFVSKSAKLDRGRFLVGAGVDVAVSERVHVEFDYAGSFQSHYNDHQFRLGVSASF